jgi:hypothetical protein
MYQLHRARSRQRSGIRQAIQEGARAGGRVEVGGRKEEAAERRPLLENPEENTHGVMIVGNLCCPRATRARDRNHIRTVGKDISKTS